MSLACHSYHDVKGKLPPALNGGTSTLEPTIKYSTLHVFILPYIEQTAVYNTVVPNVAFATNYPAGNNFVKTYLCPASTSKLTLSGAEVSGGQSNYTTHYYANIGPVGANTSFGVAAYNTRAVGSQGGYSLDGPLVVSSATPIVNHGWTMTAIQDGTSGTLLLGESSKNEWKHYRSWIRGYDNDTSAATVTGKNMANPINSTDYTTGNFNNISLSSNHNGVVMAAMVDGSVRSLSESTPLDTLKAIASRSTGEAATLN